MGELEKPDVKYAKSGDIHIAYQAFGNGPIDIVETPGSVSHLDYYWDEPGLRNYFAKVSQFARVIIFDKRGTGLSDREAGVPTFEERMDDIRAVMDAARSDNALLFGVSEGVPMSVLFAASHPTRTAGLILYGGAAKGMWTADYPWAKKPEEWEVSLDSIERDWGSVQYEKESLSTLAPSRINDENFRKWHSAMHRMGASPGAVEALMKSEMMMDVRSVLPSIHVPTLVLHVTGDKASKIYEGKYLAEHIPGASFVEIPGADHMFFSDEAILERVVKEVHDFANTLESSIQEPNRVLTTVLFTDIVDSTRKASELGDDLWQDLLSKHDLMVSHEIQRYSGREVKSTGDGVLATFDGPTRALKCACAIRDSSKSLGLEIRAGLHTGECILKPDDIAGIAVHIAERALEKADPGEVVASSTVRDLVVGAKITFREKGLHQLKGVTEKWRLYAVES